ncbi:hypothetical protein [Liquorilactobacillus oeni]|uniref:Uncharacterized protein n=1 Tax=Liquorilactobacillus oeni DSM 19972 TaxID=1423777 RepID=A0A0R1MKC7_9LACO|nr:hypothetical protein [Liquorilactobacillus oeni]KRL05845.1 hypothetical protein FD46_GL000604 [Liquorilactobacillus oeni DSM 19972]
MAVTQKLDEELARHFCRTLNMLSIDQKRWQQFQEHIDELDESSSQILAKSKTKLKKALPIQDIFVYRKCQKKYDETVREYNFYCEIANGVRQDIINNYKTMVEDLNKVAPSELKLINGYKRMINEMEAG